MHGGNTPLCTVISKEEIPHFTSDIVYTLIHHRHASAITIYGVCTEEILHSTSSECRGNTPLHSSDSCIKAAPPFCWKSIETAHTRTISHLSPTETWSLGPNKVEIPLLILGRTHGSLRCSVGWVEIPRPILHTGIERLCEVNGQS